VRVAARKKKADAAPEVEQDDDPIVFEVPVESRRLNALEQARRNIEIVNWRVRGLTWPEIAERANLSERRCRMIYQEYIENIDLALREEEPVKIVDELVRSYQAAISDLEKDAEDAPKGSPARIGARNSKIRAMRELAELLQAVGKLPTDLGDLGRLIDGQIVADRVMNVLDRFKGKPVGADFEEAMLDALGGPVKELEAGTDEDIVDADVVEDGDPDAQ
jgi:hypothetical protein